MMKFKKNYSIFYFPFSCDQYKILLFYYSLCRAKFTNYSTFHTRIYLRQPEYNFMTYDQISNLIITGILPISLFIASILIFSILTGTITSHSFNTTSQYTCKHTYHQTYFHISIFLHTITTITTTMQTIRHLSLINHCIHHYVRFTSHYHKWILTTTISSIMQITPTLSDHLIFLLA